MTIFQPIKFIEISIKQCKSGGIDCRVHGLAVMGKIVDEFSDPASAVSFLASDNEDVEVSNNRIILLINEFFFNQ